MAVLALYAYLAVFGLILPKIEDSFFFKAYAQQLDLLYVCDIRPER